MNLHEQKQVEDTLTEFFSYVDVADAMVAAFNNYRENGAPFQKVLDIGLEFFPNQNIERVSDFFTVFSLVENLSIAANGFLRRKAQPGEFVKAAFELRPYMPEDFLEAKNAWDAARAAELGAEEDQLLLVDVVDDQEA
jgi:hypothetical protein